MKKYERIPQEDEERIVTRFLFFPKTITARNSEGEIWKETRWLERASITQVLKPWYGTGRYGQIGFHWQDKGWCDK